MIVNENRMFALEKTNGRELIWRDAAVPGFGQEELVVGEAWVHNAETETMAIFHPPQLCHPASAVRGMAKMVLASPWGPMRQPLGWVHWRRGKVK